MNITLPSYFRLVDFPNRSLKEQTRHLLFFVTVVAELRKDMTPRVITYRLHDQGVRVREEEVADILRQDERNFTVSVYGDARDRAPGEVAYELSGQAKREMIRDANLSFAKLSSWKKPVNIFVGLVVLFSLVALLTIIAYHLSTRTGVDDLSWTQYRVRLQTAQVPAEERGKHLLYFITEHIKFRNDMTPEVISERLADVGLGHVSPTVLRRHFNSHPDEVIPSADRRGAYKIAPQEAERMRSLLDLKLPKEGDSLSFAWIFSHVHPSGIAAIVSGLAGLLGIVLAVGYLTGRLSGLRLSPDILLQETRD
jgi:hypothetical protein